MDRRHPFSMALGGLLLLGLAGTPTAQAGFTGFSPEDDVVAFQASASPSVDVPNAIDAKFLDGRRIEVDGKLDDEGWLYAPAGGNFRVWDPDRGAEPTEQTVFKVVYDKDAIYFGVACLESDPSNISARLARRDRFSNSDLVSVYIDPYLDRTTGYNFKVNPLGVQVDAYMFNDGDRDEDWDAVWQAETFQDEQGWYAEIRIPFSSIRYRPGPSMTWGLQVYRYMHGRGEDTSWVTWDRNASGFVSRFGELRGIDDIPPPRQMEILPYLVQRTRDPRVGPNDDAKDELDFFQNFGADFKFGITADLTLNATMQPDFGQVEADPATLNLSPFETFFEEKRPFFIEGSRFFQHPDFNLFYSRRIGTGDENSRIRFASKITGKTAGDVSVAALVAATDITDKGQAHNFLEGGTNDAFYFVGRVGREFKGGNHRFNLMQTASIKTADPLEYSGERASRDAYTTGLDFDLNFKDRTYNIQGSWVGSIIAPEEVAGDPDRTGARRYGTGASMDVRKVGGTWRGGIYGRWEGDQLDINDLGFLSAPDEINAGAWAQYRYSPDGESKLFNRGNFNYNFWKSWLYAGRSERDPGTGELVWSYGRGHRQNMGTNINGWMQWRSYWETWFGIELMPEGTQRYETRGGPLISEPTTYGGWLGMTTDTRKDLRPTLEGNYFRDVAENYSANIDVGLRWNQSSALNHQLSAGFNYRVDDTQYIETVNLAERPGGVGIGGRSYVFGAIKQRTLDITLRSNVLFSRDQSLEIYAQPFITVGDYTNGRELARPDSYDLIPYAEDGFRVRDNDFSFAAVNLNMVYRWEYRPGSAFYLVWTHSRDRYDQRAFHGSEPGAFQNRLNTEGLFTNEPENTILAKISYWFAI